MALNQKDHALVEPHLAHRQNFSTLFASRLTKMSGGFHRMVNSAGSTEGCQGGQGGQGDGSGGSSGGGGEGCTGGGGNGCTGGDNGGREGCARFLQAAILHGVGTAPSRHQ